MAGVKRIDAFLVQPERDIPAPREESAACGDVVLSHVTFGYSERTVLFDLSFTVRQGKQVTLTGRTGAGKSTVFRLLLGLYRPQAGKITIGGVDVSAITDEERRACIGCVEQHFARVPGTVLDQITLAMRVSPVRWRKTPRSSRASTKSSARCRTATTPPARTGCSRRASGSFCPLRAPRQRTPPCCWLDEITANLDAETEARVLEALRRASKGRTVLSISHRIYESLGGRTI